MDGSDGGAKRTGTLVRLLVSAIASRAGGGYVHLKGKLNTHGLKGAKGSVEKGYVRFMKAKDSVAGTPKDNTHYQLAADKLLDSILKEVATTDQI